VRNATSLTPRAAPGNDQIGDVRAREQQQEPDETQHHERPLSVALVDAGARRQLRKHERRPWAVCRMGVDDALREGRQLRVGFGRTGARAQSADDRQPSAVSLFEDVG
jgi:hypothetical protein